MRTGIFAVSPADRRRLQALMRDRNAAQKHAWRAEIVLLTADGLGTNEIMRRTGKSKTCVWRWQERFMEESFAGLLRDKTRPSRTPLVTPRPEGRRRIGGPEEEGTDHTPARDPRAETMTCVPGAGRFPNLSSPVRAEGARDGNPVTDGGPG